VDRGAWTVQIHLYHIEGRTTDWDITVMQCQLGDAMCPLFSLSIDLLSEVLVYVGPASLPQLATTSTYFVDHKPSILQNATVKLCNLLKRDIMAFIPRVPQSVDCRPPTNGPLHLVLIWLTEHISTTTELLPIHAEVITLFLRVLPLFKGVTLTAAREGLCRLFSVDGGRGLNPEEWLWLKRGIWGGDEETRVDAVRLILCALGQDAASVAGLFVGEQSLPWVVRMLDGSKKEQRWGIGLIWLLTDGSKKQKAVIARKGVIPALWCVLSQGVTAGMLPTFLQCLQILITLSSTDTTAFIVVVKAICNEIESGRPYLLQLDLCAWLGRLVVKHATHLSNGLCKRAVGVLLGRLTEEENDTTPVELAPVELASLVVGVGRFGANPALTAWVVRHLGNMLLKADCEQMQNRACRALSAIARDTSTDLGTSCPTYENAFRFVSKQDIDALLPTLTHLLQNGTASQVAHAADAMGCIAQSSSHAGHIGDCTGTLVALVIVLHTANSSTKQSALMVLSNLATEPRHAYRIATLGALQPAITILSTPLDERGAEFASSFVAILAMCPLCVTLLPAAGALDHIDVAVATAIEHGGAHVGQFTLAWSLVAVCAIAGQSPSDRHDALAWGILHRFDLAWSRFSTRKKKSLGREIVAAFRETLDRRLHAKDGISTSHPFHNNHTIHTFRCLVAHGESQTTHAVIEFCHVAGFTPPGFT
jgi:hypothetical protein